MKVCCWNLKQSHCLVSVRLSGFLMWDFDFPSSWWWILVLTGGAGSGAGSGLPPGGISPCSSLGLGTLIRKSGRHRYDQAEYVSIGLSAIRCPNIVSKYNII